MHPDDERTLAALVNRLFSEQRRDLDPGRLAARLELMIQGVLASEGFRGNNSERSRQSRCPVRVDCSVRFRGDEFEFTISCPVLSEDLRRPIRMGYRVSRHDYGYEPISYDFNDSPYPPPRHRRDERYDHRREDMLTELRVDEMRRAAAVMADAQAMGLFNDPVPVAVAQPYAQRPPPISQSSLAKPWHPPVDHTPIHIVQTILPANELTRKDLAERRERALAALYYLRRLVSDAVWVLWHQADDFAKRCMLAADERERVPRETPPDPPPDVIPIDVRDYVPFGTSATHTLTAKASAHCRELVERYRAPEPPLPIEMT